jgi:hypothetical protein
MAKFEQVEGYLYIDTDEGSSLKMCWTGRPGVPITLLDWNVEGVMLWKPVPWNKKSWFRNLISKLLRRKNGKV